ncbi:putative teichuronic acid biosynthesis glycosyltransferase TuaG [Halobacillus andaensis]|uniref:Teichuronic acid biosynthesis glycosyltransferase TuaG n=1 Tax=Halobacillus andaensis TaxID=1176239 RepID=A0A917EZ77_HALAA|nr:glycosyltransferase family 2 protein [Halobacillus andaensis]MBP2005813.1 teichuronic acid biosynthesis glycosyltransferase TuaG [Halobacillus andaensis]GGF25865.1 putative teichuronic acid biosynthesis glycosyltransferase TuaG [Halobacillus andaensis]
MVRNDHEIVSIITPAFNASNYILETIQSVKDQTYSNWEMIIVDDCSSDKTAEIVRKEVERDQRIKLITLVDNKGAATARNIAIKLSKGPYLAFLDSDDLWHPHKLEKQVNFMKEKQAGLSFTSYRIMRENGEKTDVVFHSAPQIDYHDLLRNTKIGTLTVMLDKRITGEVVMPSYRDCSEDYGLWLSILSKGVMAYGMKEELAIYRKSKNSLSGNKWSSAKKTWNTYRKVSKASIPSAIWYFANYSVHAYRKHSRIT